MDYQAVLNEVESWPVDDRVRLVQDVWDRLADQGYEPELTAEIKAELDRRIEELDRNPAAGIPWEAVKARALERIRQ
ncbi:MAG: addiction module protein [Isosphaeraceae bacterium]